MIKLVKGKCSIRRGVFETNSSSSHSVTVRGDWNEYSKDYSDKIHCDVDESTNKLVLDPDGYGWGYDTLTTTTEKLCYLVAMICSNAPYNEHYDTTWLQLRECPDFVELDKFIKEYTKYEGILLINHRTSEPYKDDDVISGDIYVDHQSCYNSIEDFLNDWRVDLERYLFDDLVHVIIDNDNY